MMIGNNLWKKIIIIKIKIYNKMEKNYMKIKIYFKQKMKVNKKNKL